MKPSTEERAPSRYTLLPFSPTIDAGRGWEAERRGIHEAAAAAGRSPPARIERKDGRDEAVFRNWTFPEEEEDVFRDTV